MTRSPLSLPPLSPLMATMETQPASRQRPKLDFKRALIPISLGVFFVLYFYVQAPVWVLALLTLWIPLFYIGVPYYTHRRWLRFEKDFAWRFSKQDHQGLLALYKDAWFLRSFGPRDLMLGKLGLIYAAMGKHRDAERVLENAIQQAEPSARGQFMLNLGQVKLDLGKYAEARQIYRRLLKRSPHLSRAEAKLNLIDAHLGKRLDEVIPLLQRDLQRAQGDERRRIQDALDAARQRA